MEKNPQNDLVYPGERVDDLQNGLYVIQNPVKFCIGMDADQYSGFADILQGSGYGNRNGNDSFSADSQRLGFTSDRT